MANKKEKAEAENNTAQTAADAAVKKKKSSLNKRKFKYGSVAAAITVIVIAMVVMVNIILNLASDKVNMSVDLTVNGNFEISDQTKDYLATVKDNVNIVCLSDELTFQNSQYIYYKQAYEVLKKYTIYSDKIDLTFVDMMANPTYAERYKESYKGDISAYSIVVENPSNGRIKVMAIQDLYNTETQFDYQSFTTYDVPVSSKAEQELTSAIMYVTDPNPIQAVLFKSETSGSSYDNVYNLLVSNGYEVSEIDPLSESIPEGTDIVVVNAPLNDYDSSVIDKLYDFLDNGGNLGKNLIYFGDYSQKPTKNIDTFLAEWGIEVGEGIIADNDAANLVSSQNPMIIRNYITENEFSGNLAQINLPVIDFQSRPVKLLFDNKDTRTTVPILSTKETAFVFTQELQDQIRNGENPDVQFGVLNTMALGRKHIFDKDNNMVYSNVLVIGSSETLDQQFTSTTYYNNGDYFISVVNTLAGKNSGIYIVAKDLSAPTFDIDGAVQGKMFAVFIVVIPLAVIIIGVMVFIRRRNK